jgi:probable rRNA maturation factor
MSRVRRSPYQIEVADRQASLKVSRPWLRKIAAGTLEAEGVIAAEISLALVNDAEIHEINRQFLEHDFATDVISFLLDEDQPAARTVPRSAGRTLSGEIVLSTDTAIAEAARFGWSPQEECALYVVHGLLHLCGYDDLTPREKKIMRAREKEVLALWDLKPSYVRPAK